MISERVQGVLAMIGTNAAKVKALGLEDLRRPFTEIDWKAVRDMQVRGAKDALATVKHMRRDPGAERRNGAILAALAAMTGAALMYLFDPRDGRSRRSSARMLLTRWYLRGRGQIDGAWHRLEADSPAFDLTEHTRADADATDAPEREVAVSS